MKRREGRVLKGYKYTFVVKGISVIPTVVIVSKTRACVRRDDTVHCKPVPFTRCQLCLNKDGGKLTA